MANANGWGDGSVNNNIGWGQGAVNNNISWGKSQITSWSGATDIDGGNVPVNTVAPAITGTAQEGQTLTCSTGTWSGSPTYTYQWKRNGSNIGSATNSTYLLVLADVGQSILCTVTATNALGSSNADSNTVTPTSSVDSDAQAFITAASITDPTQQAAINTLVVDLKGYNIWSKMKALYPFVGSTASQHKWNLKNPLDTDAAFRLVFSGGWTHSANGALPNGTNGYADTKVNAFNNLSLNSTHFSVYSRTNSSGDKRDIGAHATTEGSALILNLGGLTYYKVNSTIGNYLTVANSNTQGNFMSNRTASNVITGWKNGVKVVTGSNASTSLLNAPIYIGAIWENSNAGYFTDRQYSFASIGNGLTDTEAANFYTAVQTFQTSLARQV